MANITRLFISCSPWGQWCTLACGIEKTVKIQRWRATSNMLLGRPWEVGASISAWLWCKETAWVKWIKMNKDESSIFSYLISYICFSPCSKRLPVFLERTVQPMWLPQLSVALKVAHCLSQVSVPWQMTSRPTLVVYIEGSLPKMNRFWRKLEVCMDLEWFGYVVYVCIVLKHITWSYKL